MPIYEYRCQNGHNFEVFQGMSDDPVAACEECGAPVERVFHPVAVHFKGSGFYTTDYANKGKAGGAPSTDGEPGSGEKQPDSGSTDKKSDAASTEKPDSGSSEEKPDSGSSTKKSGPDPKTKTATSD